MAFLWKLKEKEGSKIKSIDLKKAYFKTFGDLLGKILLWQMYGKGCSEREDRY